MNTEFSSPANKWIIAITVIFGVFMSVMDISIVNVAMPHMMGSFGQDISSITWVATSYSIAEIIVITMSGWLSALIGRKRFYLISFGVFTFGSVLCGCAATFTQMMIFRVLQGIGGGALIPVSQAILRETFPPEEQGMAMAIHSMGVVLAPAIGPVFGGWLTDNYGWPWIFFINVPISIIGMIMVAANVHDPHYLRRGVKKIDWLGIALLAITLTSMQIVLERGEQKNWFDSQMIVLGTIICIISLIGLVVWQLRATEPIVNIRLLRNIPLTMGSAMSVIFGIALYGSTFIIPQMTQELLGYSASQAGMVITPRAIALLIFTPIAGWLYKRVSPPLTITTGIFIIFWSYTDLSRLSLDIGYWNLAPMLFIMGMGMPMMFVTLTTISLSTVSHKDMTDASSIFTLARRVGGNIGYALVATFTNRGIQVNRSILVQHINPLNPLYQNQYAQITQRLHAAGLNPSLVEQTSLGIINNQVNRQAAILSYNHVFWILGILFFFVLPCLFFIPRHPHSKDAA